MIGIQHISKNYGPEMALVILLSRVYFGTATADETNTFISSNTINWELVAKIIKIHQLRLFIYKIISAHSIDTDKQFCDNLKRNSKNIATGNFSKLRELRRIHALLNTAAINNIPYKGVMLSWSLFDDFISRETADIDFIINPVDFAATYQLLLDDGYESQYYYEPQYESLFLKSDNEILFTKKTSGGKFKIEIHWAITHKMMDIPFPNAVVFDNTINETILGEKVQLLDVQSQLLVLLVHHGVNDIWRTLKHTVDIAAFLQKYAADTDWSAIKAEARKYKINHTTHIGFSLCSDLHGIDIPVAFREPKPNEEKILHNILRFPPIRREKLLLENMRQQFFLRDSFTDKVKLLAAYIKTSILPNIRDVEAYPISPRWTILYIFIKPFRLLAGIVRKRNSN